MLVAMSSGLLGIQQAPCRLVPTLMFPFIFHILLDPLKWVRLICEEVVQVGGYRAEETSESRPPL